MGLFTRKPTTELPVKPCNRPKMAMLVEGIGLVEISYSNRQQPWCLSREEHAAYLSERLTNSLLPASKCNITRPRL